MSEVLATHSRMADPMDGRQVMDFSNSAPEDFFKLKIQLLDEGGVSLLLADTGNLQIKIRCYAAGGSENAMHAHHGQGHSFILLMGKARYYGPRGEVCKIAPNCDPTLHWH